MLGFLIVKNTHYLFHYHFLEGKPSERTSVVQLILHPFLNMMNQVEIRENLVMNITIVPRKKQSEVIIFQQTVDLQ